MPYEVQLVPVSRFVMASYGRKDLGPRDHIRTLASLCCICGRKYPSLKPVTPALEVLVRNHIQGYDTSLNMYPTSICVTCRLTVKAFEKDKNQTVRKFPPFMDYELIYPVGTRSSGLIPVLEPGKKCLCGLCDIGRMGLDYPIWHKSHSRQPVNDPGKKPPTVKLCSVCWIEIKRGTTHKCGAKKEKRNNINKIVHTNSDPTVSSVVRNTLKTVASKQKLSCDSSISLKSGKSAVKVKILHNKEEEKEKRVTHKDFLDIQRTLGCSDRKLLALRRCMAVILGGYIIIK